MKTIIAKPKTKQDLLVDCGKRNREIVDLIIFRQLTIAEGIREMDKNLGETLVKISDLKN